MDLSIYFAVFLGLDGGYQKDTLVVVLLVVVISSLKKSLRLSEYAAERNETLRRHSC